MHILGATSAHGSSTGQLMCITLCHSHTCLATDICNSVLINLLVTEAVLPDSILFFLATEQLKGDRKVCIWHQVILVLEENASAIN